LETIIEMNALIGSVPVEEMAGVALGPINAAANGGGVGVLAWEPMRLVHSRVGQSAGAGDNIGEPIDANCTSADVVSGAVEPAIQNAAPAAATPAMYAVRVIVELRSWVGIVVSPWFLVICVGALAAS
jgi:hypothetical protein